MVQPCGSGRGRPPSGANRSGAPRAGSSRAAVDDGADLTYVLSAMDFSLPPSTRGLLDKVRAIVKEEAYALERELAKRGSFKAILPELGRVRQRVKAEGLWTPQIPKERGGMGLTL